MRSQHRPRAESWGVECWPEPHYMGGSAHYVSGDQPDRPPVILVPDKERGGYKEHEVLVRPRGRMGFR